MSAKTTNNKSSSSFSSSPDRLKNLDSDHEEQQPEVADLLDFEGETVQQEESGRIIAKIRMLRNKKKHTEEEQAWIEYNSIIYNTLDTTSRTGGANNNNT